MREVSCGLRDQIGAVQADVAAQGRQLDQVGRQVQVLEEGLEDRIKRAVLAEVTPPATPRANSGGGARAVESPPGLAREARETSVWKQQKEQKTVAIWGWQHNTHQTA
eukprot:3094060-Amphidinium_carterae.1